LPPQKIETQARKLLTDLGIDKPPVPVDVIATKLGAHLTYSPLDGDISGMVFRDNGEVIIGINSLHHPNRQRFSIAHEIAHVVLHKGMEVHVDRTFRVNMRNDVSSRAIDPEEIEANRFAAELLMPEHMLVNDLRGQEIDLENEAGLKRLAERYRVSLQALTIRLTKLGLISGQ